MKQYFTMDKIPQNSYESKYLDDEHPILIRIPIARALNSDRQAYFLQQVKYWITINKKKPRNQHYYNDGRWWMYNTLNEWQEQFPWLTVRTIQRIIKELKLRGLLITGNYNKKKYDKTVWYSIDEQKLDEIIDEHMSVWTKCPYGSGQNDHMDVDKMSEPIPETLQENSAEAGKNSAAPSINNQKEKAVVKVYIEQLKKKGLVPVHNEQKMIKLLNDSPLAAIDEKQVIAKLKNWFKTADEYTVKQGYPLGLFKKDYNTIEKPPRVFAGECAECGGPLYEDEDHTCKHIVLCEKCDVAIRYTGEKNDALILQEHQCDPEQLEYKQSFSPVDPEALRRRKLKEAEDEKWKGVRRIES